MGQATKHRPCPAAAREISPAECGESRHSRYACPADCAFNPFAPAHYDLLLEHEDRLDLTTIRRLSAEEPDAPTAIREAGRRNHGHGHHAVIMARLFFQRAADGRTFAERWRQAGFAGLKNDERVLFQAKMKMRVALLEIHAVRDAQTVEAVDLLDPSAGVMVLVDRSVAARAVRFATILTWVYPLPHFWRLSGTGIKLPELGPLDALEAVGECVAHLGGPVAPGPDRTRWLAENFCRLDEIVAATAQARRQLMFSGMDAQFGVATYELTKSFEACRKALWAEPAVAPDDVSPEEQAAGMMEAMVWFDDAAVGTTIQPGARPVKGRVLLGPKQWRVEALGAARLADLRACFAARLGSRVRFVAERRDDIGAQLLSDGPVIDRAAVPPKLLEQPSQLDLQSSRLPGPPSGVSLDNYQAHLRTQMHRQLPDTPLPALEGKTMREAVKLPALRPTLLRVLKSHVQHLDEENLRSGRSDDLNWLLRELGLAEIDFPPPPLRPVPVDEGDEEWPTEATDEMPDEGDEERRPVEAGRPAAPRLTGAPLSFDQAVERLDTLMDSLDTAGQGLDELDLSGSTLIDDADALVGDQLTEKEFNVMVTFLLQAWFVLVPFGVRAPALDLATMEATIKTAEDTLRSVDLPLHRATERLIGDCRQPALLQAVASGLMASSEKMPKAMRPTPGGVVGILLALRAVLDELDRALRA